MDNNTMLLKRFNGEEKYQFEKGTFRKSQDDNGQKEISLKVIASKQISVLEDAEEFKILPSYEAVIKVDDYSDFKKGATFQIDKGGTQIVEDWLASFYFYEHAPANNNTIEIVDVEKDRILVKITAETQDVRFYDGSKPDTKIEIFGYFEKHPQSDE